LLFAKIDPAQGWISLTGLVSISLRENRLTISGDHWEQLWKQMEAAGGRFAITLAAASIETVEETKTGGAGTVVSLMDSRADSIQFVTGTYTSVSSGGAIGTTSGSLYDDSADLVAEASANWEHIKVDRVTVAWTDRARAPAYSPGDRLATAKVPTSASTFYTETLSLAVISRRTCMWTPLGVVTSYESAPPAPSLSSIAG
jgi:hypothetical protein